MYFQYSPQFSLPSVLKTVFIYLLHMAVIKSNEMTNVKCLVHAWQTRCLIKSCNYYYHLCILGFPFSPISNLNMPVQLSPIRDLFSQEIRDLFRVTQSLPFLIYKAAFFISGSYYHIHKHYIKANLSRDLGFQNRFHLLTELIFSINADWVAEGTSPSNYIEALQLNTISAFGE